MPSAIRLICALMALVMASLSVAPAAARDASSTDAGLHVVVSHVRSTRGHIRVDVCSAEEFLQDCVHGGAEPAALGETTILVPDVPPGVYAVQVYQDENDNHKVDRNLLGLPKEGVGFSNDAPIHLAPPKFPAAAFSYAGGDQTIHLRLRHFLN